VAVCQRGLDEHLRILRAQSPTDPDPLPQGADPVLVASLRRLMAEEPRPTGSREPTPLSRVLVGDFSLPTPAEPAAKNQPWVGRAPERSQDEPVLPRLEEDLSPRGKYVVVTDLEGAASAKRAELQHARGQDPSQMSEEERQRWKRHVARLEREVRGLDRELHVARGALVEQAEEQGLLPGRQERLEEEHRKQQKAQEIQPDPGAAVRLAEDDLQKAVAPEQSLASLARQLQVLRGKNTDADEVLSVLDQSLPPDQTLQALRELDLPESYVGEVTWQAAAQLQSWSERCRALESARQRAQAQPQPELPAPRPQPSSPVLARAQQHQEEAYARYRAAGGVGTFLQVRDQLKRDNQYIDENGELRDWDERPFDRTAGPGRKVGPTHPIDLGSDPEGQALLAARRQAQLDWEAAGSSEQADVLKNKIAQISEELGHLAARRWREQQGYVDLGEADPSFRQIVIPRGRDAFDLVFLDQDGHFVVVECKGGSSERGGRMDEDGLYVQQGSRAYLRAVIAAIRQREQGTGTHHADQLEQALEQGKVRSVVVRAPVNAENEPGKVVVTEYDLTRDYPE
jgi:hypothetical protein